MAQVDQGTPQYGQSENRLEENADHADVTKKSTPELCPAIKTKAQNDVQAQLQQRICSQSQASVVKSRGDAGQASHFRQNVHQASNNNALKRQAMNDTFSEDAWKKLNSMKQQRQQKLNGKGAPAANHAGSKAGTLNIVNQRPQGTLGSVKPLVSTKASLIEDEYHLNSRGESSDQRLKD